MRGRFLTSDLPPIEGRTRVEPGDFVVEEVLLYEPSGEGTHLWLTIEKTGLTTFEAIRRIARALGRREDDFGHAGLKDKAAVTRQTLSIEFATEAEAAALDVPGLRVLDLTRHRNKLKVGHLRGNRFRLRIRDARPGDPAAAGRLLAELGRRGVPNFFGEQRFGRSHATPRLGRCLLAADYEGFLRGFADPGGTRVPEGGAAVPPDGTRVPEGGAAVPPGGTRVPEGGAAVPPGGTRVPEGGAAVPPGGTRVPPADLLARAGSGDPLVARALRVWSMRGRPELGVRALPRRLLSLCTAAVQAEAFNAVLDRRLGTLDTVVPGDVAYLHRNGACFLAEDAADCARRAAAFEISPTGPLPGPACLAAAGAQAQLESEVLAALDLDPAAFALRRPWAQKGGRRPLRVPLTDPRVSSEPAGRGRVDLLLAFELPRGSYATAVLAELFHARA